MASSVDYAKMVQELSEDPYTEEDIVGFAEYYAYQGFKHVEVVKALVEKFPNDKDGMMKAVRALITVHLTRGNKISSILKKISSEGGKSLKELTTKIGIKDKAVGPQDLTLSRIAITFAGLTCSLIEILKDHIGIGRPHLTATYPYAMMHSAFASMIDPTLQDEVVSQLVSAFKLYLYRFTRMINPSKTGEDFRRLWDSNLRILQAATQNSFHSADTKRAYLVKWGVLDKNFLSTPAVKEAAKAFEALQADNEVLRG
uniref:Nucleoprotein n=1 Tax=Kabuto mountain virus TaxID=1851087 RepID=A0A679CAJ1_9VIRU|nr:nucleocapsid protein [Kabuto mountain virus]